MKKFIIAALAFTTIIWGTTAGALRQSQQERLIAAAAGAGLRLVDHGNRGGTGLVGHAGSRPHVVTAAMPAVVGGEAIRT